ncbi:MAG TPA: universal stress protein, partial [Chloroflexota bacterium]|nr:universal stress protein [Chloroflexota bacterium]
MYERILIALDGSGASEVALTPGLALARACGAEVLLLRVVSGGRVLPELVLSAAEPSPAPGAVDVQALAGEESEAVAYLDSLIARLDLHDLQIIRKVSIGSAARTIAAEAETYHADLLVLATRGRGGLARLVLGSVAEAVLRLTPCPVVLVPAPTTTDEPSPPAGQILSFEEEARRGGPLAPKPLGLRTVDVARIVGSVGRARELGPDFRPPIRSQRRQDDERYDGIVKALQRGDVLPPIDLYKVGYNYFVLDGNHRVAAARATHQRDIDAIVTEFLPVSNEESATVFGERREFERLTGLLRIGASRVGHYPRLEELIRIYAADPANKPSGYAAWQDDDLRSAARHWFYNVYEPAARAIRTARLARCFPSERTADIFVHLANFRDDQVAITG